MLIFIDESGDAGFRVAEGSSRVFVAAMAVFQTRDFARAADDMVSSLRKRLGVRGEFKFNQSRDEVRDEFFRTIVSAEFLVRAIVVDKSKIYSPHLKSDKQDFYRFFVAQMLKHDGGTIQNARVVIDGSGDRAFRKVLGAQFRKQLGARLKDLRFADSARDNLVQLADMCVGAIARSYRDERTNSNRWRAMLSPRISDIWDFK